MNSNPWKEYYIQTEPTKQAKGYAWHTAIGLQAVDGLKPSKYLVDTAIQNIEGKLSMDEVQKRIDSYYKENPKFRDDSRTEEADKVSLRIARLLSEKAFSFTPNEYISIHRKLFTGIYKHAGKLRDYNITKSEWILDGETVLYGSASELRATLEYDFTQERSYNYHGLSMDEIIHHLAVFISRLWQIHIFGEGNTRTTAVFFIKYLRSLGFEATTTIFAENAWYFRNALVRANYNNFTKGIHETTEYLELFLQNLLCNKHHELHNRSMHISGIYENQHKTDMLYEKVNIQNVNTDTEYKKVNSDTEPSEINIQEIDKKVRYLYKDELSALSPKTIAHVQSMYDTFSLNCIFGRSDMQQITGLGATRASALLKLLTEKNILQTVRGHGKGKYQFH